SRLAGLRDRVSLPLRPLPPLGREPARRDARRDEHPARWRAGLGPRDSPGRRRARASDRRRSRIALKTKPPDLRRAVREAEETALLAGASRGQGVRGEPA